MLFHHNFRKLPAELAIYELRSESDKRTYPPLLWTKRVETDFSDTMEWLKWMISNVDTGLFPRNLRKCGYCDYSGIGSPCWQPEVFFGQREIRLDDADEEVLFKRPIPTGLVEFPEKITVVPPTKKTKPGSAGQKKMCLKFPK